jgi:hypothetical protein
MGLLMDRIFEKSPDKAWLGSSGEEATANGPGKVKM